MALHVLHRYSPSDLCGFNRIKEERNHLQDFLQRIALAVNYLNTSKVTELLRVHASHDTLLRLLYKMELSMP